MRCLLSSRILILAPLFTGPAAMAAEVVMDVRTPDEFAESHVKGAVNLDVSGASFQRDIKKLDKTGTYYVYCRTGRRSAEAIQQMKDAGFTSVKNLGSAKDAADTLKRTCEGKSTKC